MKRISVIFLSCILIVLMLVIPTSATELITIDEIYNVNIYENNFSVIDNSFSETGNTATQGTVTVTNNSDIDASFDLLVFFESSESITVQANYDSLDKSTSLVSAGQYTVSDGTDSTEYSNSKVLLIGETLGSLLSNSVTITFEVAPTAVHFVVLNYYAYNYYINNFFDLQTLNNEYAHNITSNDVDIDTLDAVYSQYSAITSYDQLSEVEKTNCYIIDTDGNYIWASSTNTTGVSEFYYKTYIQRDIYTSNTFKNVYIISDMETVTTTGGFSINYPCNLYLYYADITLNSDFLISHHYMGTYEFDAISSTINNDNFNFNIYTPRAYYKVTSSSYLTSLVNTTITTDLDLSDTAVLATIMSDAKTYMDNYFSDHYIYGDKVITDVFTNILLPFKFHDYGISIDYEIYTSSIVGDNYEIGSLYSGDTLCNYGDIQRPTDTETYFLKYTFTYDGEEYTDDDYYNVISVIGTSAASIAAAYKAEIQQYINTSINDESNFYDIYLGIADDASSIANRFNTNNDSFSVTYSIPTVSEDVLTLVSVYKDAILSGYYLEQQAIIAYDQTGYLNMEVNSVTTTAELDLQGVSVAEKTAYVGRYINSVYIDQLNVDYDMVYIENSNISTLDITSMNYEIVKQTNNEGVITETVVDSSYYAFTPYVDNTLTSLDFITTIDPEDNEILYIKLYIEYDHSEDGFTSQTTAEQDEQKTIYREIIVPAAGIGGNGDPEYVSKTFSDTFLAHAETIYSGVGDFSFSTSGLYFTMTLDTEATYTANGIASADEAAFDTELATYFEVVETGEVTNPSTHLVYILVDTANIPDSNTIIIMTSSISDTSTFTSQYDQSYSFIIPGIYFNSESEDKAFGDNILYKYLLSIYNSTYVSGDLRAEYLLTDEAQSIDITTLDCSKATIKDYFSTNSYFTSEDEFTNLTESTFDAHQLVVKGMQYLTSTTSINFDGWEFASADTFKYLVSNSSSDSYESKDNITITDLSFVGCNLSNTYSAYLAQFIRLENVDFSDNQFSDFPVLYRTVETVNMSNQNISGVNTLDNIDNISQVVNLVSVDLSDNIIASFRPLISLSSNRLEQVTLYNNDVTNASLGFTYALATIYGTDGVSNISVYTWLFDNGVSVYTTNTALTYTDGTTTYDLIRYFDVSGNVINTAYTYLYDSDPTAQQTELVTNEYYFGSVTDCKNISNQTQTLYTKASDGTLSEVTSTDTIYMHLSYNQTIVEKKINVAINSIIYESNWLTEGTTITVPSTISNNTNSTDTYTLTLISVNDVIASTNTISSLANGDILKAILLLSDGTYSAYREAYIIVWDGD